MARRKSLNRRLSRYSRNSTGSAFLDPDTENLGDEQPYWWKNLENNTVIRPSLSYNTPNQTSPILDPNSRVDSGQLQDGWWKVLDTTDIADDAKLTKSSKKPDADNNTGVTLESDEEPRIIKRKVTLRTAVRKSRGNPFVNISESESSDEKSTGESPTNKSGFIEKNTTSSKQVNKISESSSGESHSTDVVLKLKPTLFKRKRKDRQQNVFDDVLKETELLTPKQRKSLQLSSHSKTGALMENKIPAMTDSPIVKQGGKRKLVLSFENDHDLSRLPNPEAQSTLLESSSSTHTSNKENSEMETRVLKPKSTFLKRRKRHEDKNVFADIFAEEEAHNDVEISKWKEKGIDKNAEASKTRSVGQAGGSFRGSQSTSSNVVNEIRSGDAKGTEGSPEAISPLAQDPRGPAEPNASAQASIASSDTSDKSQDPNIFLKPRSTFLKRSRKHAGRNIFQEILEEDGDVDALRQSRSDTLIDRTKKDLMMKKSETRRRGSIDQESNTGSEDLHLELPGSSEEDGTKSKEASEFYGSTYSDIEFSEHGSDPKEKRQRRSTSHVSPEIPEMSNRRTDTLPWIINEVSKSGGGGTCNVRHREAASDVDALGRSRSDTLIDRTKEDLMMKNQVARETRRRGIINQESSTGSELYRSSYSDIEVSEQSSEPKEKRQRCSASIVSPEIPVMSNRRTSTLPRIIQKVSKSGGGATWKVRHRDSASDVDVSVTSKHGEDKHTKSHERDVLEDNKGSSHKLHAQLSIDTWDDFEQEFEVIERPRRKSTGKLGKPSFRPTVDDSEPDVPQSTPSRSSKKLRTSIRQSTVINHRDTDLEPVQSTPKRQSKSLSKSQKLLSSRVISEAEVEDVQASPKRQSKSLSKSQKLLSPHVTSESEMEDVQETTKRQSKSLSKSHKSSRSRVISEDETGEVQETPKRQSKSLSKSQKLISPHVTSESEMEDVQETTKRQSKSLSKSQKSSRSRVISEDEAEEVEETSKRQNKSLSKSEKLLSPRVINEDEAEDVEETPKRQRKSLGKSQKLLSPHVTSESETEDVQETTKRQSKSLSKSQKSLRSRVISEDEAEEVDETLKKQSKSLSKSQKLLGSPVISEDEAEDVQETPKRQSKSLNKLQKLLSPHVTSESEMEDVQETTIRQNKSLSKSQKSLRFRVISEDETEDVEETPKRQTRSLSKSQKLLSSRVMSESETEDFEETTKRQSKTLSKSRNLLTSPVISEDEAEDVQANSKKQSNSLSKSQKLLSSRVISEDEAKEVEATSKRQSRSLSKSQKLLSSPVVSESETEDVQETTKRQSKSLSKSQKLLSSRVISEDEAKEVEATSKRQSRSLNKSQKLLSPHVTSESEMEDVQETTIRQNKSLSKSQKSLRFRVISEDETEDVEETPKRQTRSLSKSQKLLSSRVMSESETEDFEETTKRQSKTLSKSRNLLTSPVISEDEAEDVQANSKKQSNSLSKSQKLLSSRVISEDEAKEVEATSKRQSRSLSKSQKLLSSPVVSESETEDVQETTKRQSKSLSKSQKLLSSPVISEDEAEDVQVNSKKQSKSLSKSQKLLSSPVMSEDEAEEVEATLKRQSRSLSKLQKLLSSPVVSESETEDVQETTKRRSKSLRMSQKSLRSRVMSEDEAEEVEATSKRRSRSLSKSQKLLSSPVVSESETEDVQETTKRRSKRLRMSQKSLRSRVMSEDEAEEVEATSKRRSRSLSKSQKLLSSPVVSESETEDVQETTKRRSKSLRMSQKSLRGRVISEDEAEEVRATSKRQSRNLSKSRKLLSSPVVSESETEDVQETTKRRSKSLRMSQKSLRGRVISEDEAEEVRATSKRQSRNLSKSRKLLSSPVVSEDEAEEVEATSKRQSKSLSKSQKLLSSRVISEAEEVGVQETPKRQSQSLNKSRKLLSSPVISVDESEKVEATSKKQSRNLSMSQKLLSSRVISEDEAEEIQSTQKTRESKSAGKTQKRSTLNAIKEFEAQVPNTPERGSKVLSKLPNDISSAADQIEPCEIDDGAKRQSKSISRVERQSTVRILGVSAIEEVEINQPKHSRNFMYREPSVSPARTESQSTVPVAGKSNMHRIQEEEEEEEEEEEGGIDAGAKSFSATRRSEQQIALNPNVTKDQEDEDLLNASRKNAKEAKEVSRNDTGRNVRKNRSVALGKVKGSVGSTMTSTNRAKNSTRSQRNIDDFLIMREAVPASQVFADKEKAEKLKRELEKIKKQAMDDMKLSGNSHKSKLPLQQKKPSNLVKTANATQKQRPAKPIHKAFLVNGQVYKVPRLPRPKYWVTDRLYKYLWKQLEPKYSLQTRVISEKFVLQLSNVTSFIVKQKSYTSYRAELYALMKEMARLGIIRTRYEFYIFCQEFFPYELRVKVVPMLLPGNKRNIPYAEKNLNEPLLGS